MIFRGKFRSRIILICLVLILFVFQLDNIKGVISDFITENNDYNEPGK